MQEFTLNTIEGKLDVLTASNWNELTLDQLIQLESTYKDDLGVLRAFSILTGLSLEISENLKDKHIESKVNQVVNFLSVAPDWENLARPDVIFIDGKPHKIPTKFGGLMLGQKILIEQLVKEDTNLVDAIPKMLSIVLQPYIDKTKNKNKLRFSHERAAVIEKKLLKSDALSCYAISLFFFNKLKSITNFGMKSTKISQSQKSQTKRLYPNWLKGIDLKSTVH